MKKRILMLCSIWHNEYISKIFSGIQRYINQEDLELHIFAMHESAENQDYQRKEQEIFSLPNLEMYDGVLLAVTSIADLSLIEGMLVNCRKSGKPVLSIDLKIPEIANIGIDNYKVMYEIVEHMIVVHGCKVINYLGGPADNEENNTRFRAFCDCLKHYQIPIEEDRILNCHFLYTDGKRAYGVWKEKGKHLPDVVVCANDNMAIGYCDAAGEDGYFAPESFKVTGFDNFEDGQFFYPSITSVNRDLEQHGYNSVCHLVEMINGKKLEGQLYTEGKVAINESCGCGWGTKKMRSAFQYVYSQKQQDAKEEERQRKNRQNLCTSYTVEELQQKFNETFESLAVDNIALCLNPSVISGERGIEYKGYEPKMLVVTKFGQYEVEKVVEPRKVLGVEEQKMFLFTGVHSNNYTYGYCVAAYDEKLLNNNFCWTFVESIALSVENICQKEEVRRMNRKLQELYVMDQLTGLYNRFGYAQMAEKYFMEQGGKIYLVYIDVDNLKKINDGYGHNMGDIAIKGVAKAIKEVFWKEQIRVRLGGDEFLVIGSDIEEADIIKKEEEVSEFLEKYSEQKKLPFVLRASMGHVRSMENEDSLEALVNRADDKMYEIKQKRKSRNL